MKNNKKAAFNQGFTLIELMIVIVIIGILTISFFPSFTGSQGRARDAARVKDLSDLTVAIETYLGDINSYPGFAGTAVCLKPGDGNYDTAFDIVADNFNNGLPKPESDTESLTAGGITCVGGYIYLPVLNKGQNPGAYAVVANTETPTKGNFIPADLTYDVATTLDDLIQAQDVTPEKLIEADDGAAYLLVK